MINSSHPVEQSKRTPIVDILRGWAILGVAIGNYSDFINVGLPQKPGNNIISEVLYYISRYFFASKSWTLLALLFGYGFAILINNVSAKGKNPVTFFTWRMLLLLVLAIIHTSFWFGDILKDYVVLGLLLLLFYKFSAKTVTIICAFLVLTIPFVTAFVKTITFELPQIITNPEYLKLYYSGNWLDFFRFNFIASVYGQILIPDYAITGHIIMFACMLFGLLLQKTAFFNRLNDFKKTLHYILIISLCIAVMTGVSLYTAIAYKAAFLNFFHPHYWLVLSTMIFIATGIILLYSKGKLKRIFNYLSAGGKMTLTNYIFQNIAAAFIFSGIGLAIKNSMPYWFYFSLACSVFILQLFISKWWLAKYNYGPIEWLWRSASYQRFFPFKKIPTEVISEIKPI